MNILIVSSYLPFPLFSGGQIRLYNLIKNLSEKHSITLVCEKRESQTQRDIDEVSKICEKVYAVDRKKQWSAKNIIKTGFSLDPFLITGHKSPEMKKIITRLVSEEKFDLIHVETFYVMQNLPKTDLPVVLAEHNIEYKVYEKFVKKSLIIGRPLLYLDILKLKRTEKAYWKKATKLIAVSEIEASLMGRKVDVIPNGVEIDKFKMKKIVKQKENKKVLFIGDFKWIQNKDSVVYIIKNIWPKVVKNNPNAILWIVGKKIPESVKSLKDDSIIFDENAPNETEKIFQEADILLTPIRVGGGTNFKILESMSCGTPVITTKLGNEGIKAIDNEEIIICDKPEEFSSKTSLLLTDDYLYEKISRNGRKFIEKSFDWKNIAEKLNSVYSEVGKRQI
ncbi:glycosyltransferase family 4 protein [Candidatus Roizmanbacteria bacterium]|nr:glycosyltransferase family 4 protein [Candidatus Roizmanbacteria bacterium]